MDFGWSKDEGSFRQRVRDFLDEHWTNADDTSTEGQQRGRNFEKVLADNGWLTMAWPEQYGGQGASHVEQMIYKEEAALHAAPTGGGGVSLVGPTLQIHGTEEQKKEHLPKIANAEVLWCQGYSEPGSGSDLASLQIRAVRDGDDFIINGQKIWTSGAQRADWIHVLKRTEPDAPKHRGISYFMVRMDTPGITVQPIEQMHGARGFNETFFEDARVPARNIIGEENRGWYVATTTLDFERSGVQRAAGVQRSFARLLGFANEPDSAGRGQRVADGALNRHTLSETAIEIEVGRYLGYRVAWMQSRGLVPNYESSMSKAYNSELSQRNARRGISLLGLHGTLRPQSDHSVMDGQYCQLYMSTVSATIAAGTSEIQRNVIATRGLGLPRG
ncbi:MAG: acyl-CoA dehydrogenase family protein [Dehalococcoidia bacterium]|nr:acyl-CoA dehydrogenase family protein [Dehalococcoidia bacterium]